MSMTVACDCMATHLPPRWNHVSMANYLLCLLPQGRPTSSSSSSSSCGRARVCLSCTAPGRKANSCATPATARRRSEHLSRVRKATTPRPQIATRHLPVRGGTGRRNAPKSTPPRAWTPYWQRCHSPALHLSRLSLRPPNMRFQSAVLPHRRIPSCRGLAAQVPLHPPFICHWTTTSFRRMVLPHLKDRCRLSSLRLSPAAAHHHMCSCPSPLLRTLLPIQRLSQNLA